jgi:hydrogenase maturation protease
VIGVGNDLRADDGAGLQVVRRLRAQPGVAVKAYDGEAIGLLELWAGADAAVLVDTVRSGAAPGTMHRLEVTSEPLPTAFGRSSSHTISIADVIELARTLGTLPARVVVFGVEGARFAAGEELSQEVAGAIESVADAVRREARELAAGQPSRSHPPAPSRPRL